MSSCLRGGLWRIQLHAVDTCQARAGGVHILTLCRECFDFQVHLATVLIAWGVRGLRPPACLGCGKAIDRLSDIVQEVDRE